MSGELGQYDMSRKTAHRSQQLRASERRNERRDIFILWCSSLKDMLSIRVRDPGPDCTDDMCMLTVSCIELSAGARLGQSGAKPWYL